MAAKKRNRQQVRAKHAAHARRAAEIARRRRIRRQRLTIAGVMAIVVVVGIAGGLALASIGDDDGTDLATSTSTTADPDKPESAAGKPCVAVADPLPAGAPSVPLDVGPPPTTLITKDLKEGAGAVVAEGQTLTVNYIGVACSTGKIFDASYSRGEPVSFPLTNVIPGWQKGLPGMKVGGQRLLGIPPDQGYGDQGDGQEIAPGESLWFVVEVVDAKAA